MKGRLGLDGQKWSERVEEASAGLEEWGVGRIGEGVEGLVALPGGVEG